MQRQKDDNVFDNRYQTPESFRTRDYIRNANPPGTAVSVGKPEPEKNSPDRLCGEQYQYQETDMSNQVFGNSKPGMMQHNMRPEPLDMSQMDENSADLDQTPYSNREPRPYAYDYSPRHHPEYYDDRSYRSGRPDIGPQHDSYVPYPQEPIHRVVPGQSWTQPPSIGYAPHGHGSEAKPKDDKSPEDDIGPHPGWLLLIRFNKTEEDQVQKSLFMCQKHIDADGGRILGMAKSYGVKIREGGDNWVTYGKLRYAGGGVWSPQNSPMQTDTHYCVLAIYYPSLTKARQWWDRDSMFKQKDFPKPNGADCIALPLSSSVDTGFNKTLVLTEYPKISQADYFRDKFSVPTEDMMTKRFRASPYVVKTTYIPSDDLRARVAHHFRGAWLKRNSIITLSMFDSMNEAYRYFSDPDYFEAKKHQDRVSAPTTMIFDLEDWRPKYPNYGAY